MPLVSAGCRAGSVWFQAPPAVPLLSHAVTRLLAFMCSVTASAASSQTAAPVTGAAGGGLGWVRRSVPLSTATSPERALGLMSSRSPDPVLLKPRVPASGILTDEVA